MQGSFNIPSVDHLREGIDYTIVDWDFADKNPAPKIPHTPGQPCPEGTKMVFGLCRRVDKDTQDWKPGDDTDEERRLKQQAEREGSKFENNKAISAGGKKFGWAMKGGKPVLVEWGSVAGTKKAPTGPMPNTQKSTQPKPKTASPSPGIVTT